MELTVITTEWTGATGSPLQPAPLSGAYNIAFEPFRKSADRRKRSQTMILPVRDHASFLAVEKPRCQKEDQICTGGVLISLDVASEQAAK